MWLLKDGLYREQELEKCGVVNFTTTVLYGDMKNEKNRREFLKKYPVIKNVIYGIQTHSCNIEIVTKKDIGKKFYATDGFITNRKNLSLAVFTADCLPVFIYDTVKKVIGLVHAGRLGLKKLILEKAITIFVEKFGSTPASIFVAIGPHIKKCCYDVDLDSIAINQIRKSGVKKISNVVVCTHDRKFFSYRKNKTDKRMMSLMMMEGK
ncbi:MAG: polyphenol oxidase family protein [Elusimicrobiota bacterium]